MGNIRLFVSHAHKDKEIAVALVEVIEAALDRPKPQPQKKQEGERILCTSHDNKVAYGYPEEFKDVTEFLKDHLGQSAVVLGVLTPNSNESKWCLFELGGAWALAKKTYILIAGLTQVDLPAALKGTLPSKLTNPEDIQRVLKNLSKDLGWKTRDEGAAAQEINRLIDTVRGCTWRQDKK